MGLESLLSAFGGGGTSTSSSASSAQDNTFYNMSGINFRGSSSSLEGAPTSADSSASSSAKQPVGSYTSPSDNLLGGSAVNGGNSMIYLIGAGVIAAGFLIWFAFRK